MGRVLVLCEMSGVVREAFKALGHNAWSCDLLPTEIPGQHYREDCFGPSSRILEMGWDLVIAHPPCTHIAVSGAAHFAAKRADGRQQEGIDFFMKVVNLPYQKMVIENPVCIMSSIYRKPDQIIHPWMFGHMEQKATCLWFKGLPLLEPTNNVKEQMLLLPKKERERLHYMSPGPNRAKERSRTFSGIGLALAEQYGALI